jgi:alpha/beta superfamily hydrolase
MTVYESPVHLRSAGSLHLKLEGRWHTPAGPGPFPAAVVAHPHPLMGGSMRNSVVVWLARTLAERGWAALCVNFRGVGRSQGHYDEGQGETDDLVGGLNWLTAQRQVDAGRLAVVGYSFGARVAALAAARDERVRAYAAVALTQTGSEHVDLGRLTRPKFFIVGGRDDFGPPEFLLPYVNTLPDPKTVQIISGADHMLFGHEQAVAGRVADFLKTSVS